MVRPEPATTSRETKPTSSRLPVAKGNPLLRKRVQAEAKGKAKKGRLQSPERGTENRGLPPAGGCDWTVCKVGVGACKGPEKVAKSGCEEGARPGKLWTRQGVWDEQKEKEP